MTEEPKHKEWGTPLSEWVKLVPGELPLDAVGLWQILVAANEGFELRGEAKHDFMRRCILALLDAGAVPVEAAPYEAKELWAPIAGYEGPHEMIAEQIVQQWEGGEIRDDHDGMWFARSFGLKGPR